MKRVAILYGGKSGEHEVSCRSAASILRHMDKEAFQPVLIGISREGVFYLQKPYSAAAYPEAADTLAIEKDDSQRVFAAPADGLHAQGKKIGIDLVFPVLHGTFGEDGTVQGLLECAGLPYVGARVMGSSLSFDKEKTKRVWQDAGLPVVPFICAHRHEFSAEESRVKTIAAVEKSFPYPVFVKPVCAGSSCGAGKANDRAGLVKALTEALAWDVKALIEPFIPAREIECSVLGNDRPEAYGPGEIVPHHEFYDYEAKYSDPDGAELCIPAKIPEAQAALVRETALKAYQALDCAGFARVDFFLDRQTGKLALNEINTIPGFTSISMYPMMCEAGGVPYSSLITRLLDLAESQARELAGLRYK
jgi:D-alanine-D-alanine ligase